MTAPDPTHSPPQRIRGVSTADVNPQVVLRVVVGIIILGLAISSVALFVAGAHKNGQIDDLKANGIRVQVTATGCLGLLGGSGSNAAGYDCKGAFTFNGHHHVDTLPGGQFHRPGTVLSEMVARDNPGLIDTVHAVATERASGTVYVLPAILAVVALALLGLVAALTHRSKLAASN
jgi:hypothetical protein